MKIIKKILICFSLCLVLGTSVSISAQAACGHAEEITTTGTKQVGPCTFQNYSEAKCKYCGVTTRYQLNGGQYVSHHYYTTTTSYKTYDGRTVYVTKYTCSACGHTYSTSSVN